jgi:hypothetical protein
MRCAIYARYSSELQRDVSMTRSGSAANTPLCRGGRSSMILSSPTAPSMAVQYRCSRRTMQTHGLGEV